MISFNDAKNLGIAILAVIGGFQVILAFLETLCRIIPNLNNQRVRLWRFLAEKWSFKKLEKKAIASDIENTVNEVVLNLRNELPNSWLSKAAIKWVDREIKEDDLSDGEMILRIRPLESQDTNLMNGVYVFFSKALFPETKEIIPLSIRKAAALQISRRTISNSKPFLTERFEKGILECAIKNDPAIVEYIEKYNRIDNKGFFTGSFLREIHEIATRAQFKELRNQMLEEVKGVLFHIEEFVGNIGNLRTIKWSRNGPATSYSFLLVAKPYHDGVDVYIKRVREKFSKGVERIYVMGTSQEKRFVEKVISEIAKLPECRLVEIFKLHKDYRGDRNGIGALFVKGGYDAATEQKIDSFFSDGIQQ